jgi:hypothetical protein
MAKFDISVFSEGKTNSAEHMTVSIVEGIAVTLGHVGAAHAYRYSIDR